MELLDYLTPETTILTPNRRLAATLLKLHNIIQINHKKLSWTTLDVLPITSWVQRLWQNYTARQIQYAPLILSPNQEQILWEEILSQSAEGDYLLQVSSTAELARQAYATLQQWQVELSNPALTTTEDGIIFQGWASQFENVCEKNNWITANSITNLVIQKIQTGAMLPPAQIIIKGFTELSPQYQCLMDACETAQCRIIKFEPEELVNKVSRLGLQDEETEIRTMARWAKANSEKNAEATIGCVFPRLESNRDAVIQIFSEVFADKNTFSLNYTHYPFNISAGKNLAHYPVIHMALQILQLNPTKTSLDVFTTLLHTSFIGEAESEMNERAIFDNALRSDNISTISLKKIRPENTNCPFLAKRLQQFIAASPIKKASAHLSTWVEIFMRQLTELGWPGERSLSSHEYQVVDRWLRLLGEFASFENMLGEVTHQRALHYLTYLTTKEIFQPESPETKIQLLGMLEAAEIPFDHLWVMGMDDNAWPPSPKPNPFIPQRLQKSSLMPHATAERELLYCRDLTQQLQRGAAEVIFSYAEKNEEAELRPSPIITAIPETTLTQLDLSEFINPAKQIYASQDLAELLDENAPPIASHETIRGGTNIFKLQAACPFRAFAELRLHVKNIDAPTPGLNPKDRGQIVHHSLELLWQELSDLTHLQQHPDLPGLIHDCVEKAMNLNTSEVLANKRFRALEATRLEKLLLEWLENEKTRRYFKVIALEEERTTTIANIPVVMRIDRIDQLDNGKNIIIDYKTGKGNEIRAWLGDRPDEPQLPIYCVLEPEQTAGILFAQLNSEEMGFTGLSEFDLQIKSVKTPEDLKIDWNTQIQQWQTTLEKLGSDFAAGHAAVDPKIPEQTCQHCHLQLLCRI